MSKMAITRKEAAETMGISLPMLDCYLHRANNPLPHIRVGRKVIVPVEGLQKWLAEEAKRQIGG